MENNLWHWEGRAYRLVDQVLVSYPRSERRKVDGRNVLVALPPLEYTVCTAFLLGNEKEGEHGGP